MRLSSLLGLGLTLALSTGLASADTIAQFDQAPAANDFVFTSGPAGATFATIAGGSPVTFHFSNLGGVPLGDQVAHAFLSASSTLAASSVNDSGDVILFQPLSAFVLEFRRDSDNALLLRATLTPAGGADAPQISGLDGDNSAALDASSAANNTVVFESDFFDFSTATQRDAALGFSSVDPVLVLDGDFLKSFTAAGTGTFSIASIPEPATMALVGLGGVALVRRRRGH
jgi:hypothetical protein